MDTLIFAAASILAVWGGAHLFATRGVLAGFGELTTDNRRIVTMEWMVEGVALIATAAYTGTVTALDSSASASNGVYGVTIVTLVVLAIVSLLTGFRVAFPPFRLCPIIFTLAAVLIAVGAWA